jgi:hypothetical protein
MKANHPRILFVASSSLAFSLFYIIDLRPDSRPANQQQHQEEIPEYQSSGAQASTLILTERSNYGADFRAKEEAKRVQHKL